MPYEGRASGAIFAFTEPYTPSMHDMKQPAAPTFILKLYVTGTSPRTRQAIDNLQRICEQDLHGLYHLEIIDVLEHPQQAEDQKILATPTLIKQLPPPLRRVIGDLSDREKVLLGLEVRPLDPSTPTRPDR
jgi:circadian clock protein KaiB